MKKVLITGRNSYIGKQVKKWLEQHEDYNISEISMREDSWKTMNLSKYDVVFHVAGIAHVSTDPSLEDLYYKVNRDMTIELAKKAKSDGVQQFIFMSSIIVYGEMNRQTMITEKTEPKPSNFYGNSKLEAEKGIIPLDCETFKVAVIRPPMIYGKNSKGNYLKLSKAARKLPFFPNIENKRSMLHIDNLCELIRLIIKNEDNGKYFPQNNEYVKTSEMVRLIAEVHGKRIKLVKLFNPFIKLFVNRPGVINKVFGDLVYDQKMSRYIQEYRVRSLPDSIRATEME